MSTSIGTITCGFLLTILAGILNGSWNASFSPKLGIALKSTTRIPKIQTFGTKLQSFFYCCNRSSNNVTTEEEQQHCYDLDYQYSWILFQLYACIFNIVICVFWSGGLTRVCYIISQSPNSSIILVSIFSFLWGIGSVVFGLACRIAGVGLGTNLTMSVIVILGTFLPLVTNRLLRTATGGVILFGLFVSCIGLYFSMKSLKIRDSDERKILLEQEEEEMEKHRNTFVVSACTLSRNNDIELKKDDNITANKCPKDDDNIENTSTTNPVVYTSTQKVILCMVAGILSSLLQFAFIFGQPIIDIAKTNNNEDQYGTTPQSGSAAIVWLFALVLGIPPSIIYGLYTSSSTIPFYIAICKCPWYRHIFIFLFTSIPWVSHIHLYGLAANTFLPPRVAASIAWPVLMMVTVIQGMILSIYLGEWKIASRISKKYLCIGLIFAFFGTVILMASIIV